MARAGPARPGRARATVCEDSFSPGDEFSRADQVVGSGEARERILDAAEDLFAADGFDATPPPASLAEQSGPRGCSSTTSRAR